MGFTLGLAGKDVNLAVDLGHASGIPMHFGDLAAARYAAMVEEAGYNAQVEASGLISEREAGTTYIPAERDI